MKPVNKMVMSASLAIAMGVTAFSSVCLFQCAPTFERPRKAPGDTFYGDIKFGMTKEEVKQRMKPPFRLESDLPDQLSFRDSGRNLLVDFVFENGRLVMTDSYEE